jgi:V8-like Glu-specific endopeptidase
VPEPDPIEVKERVERSVLDIPGVHAIGVGSKVTGGEVTGEESIKIFVEQKRPLEEIPHEERIPPEIDGVKTDVVEQPVPTIQQAIPGQLFGASRVDTGEYRPIRGGTQVARAAGSGVGTLGCMFTVLGDPNTILAVTNHHVIYGTCGTVPNHEEVGQPNGSTSSSACCSDIIGTVLDAQCDADVDIALIKLTAGSQYLAEVHEIGRVTASHVVTHAEATSHTFQVKKRGRTTRLTGGTIQADNLSGSVNNSDGTLHRTYAGAMSVLANPDPASPGTTTNWSLPGDSGSAVLSATDAVVGIHFGGSPATATASGSGLFIPVKAITDKFGNFPVPRQLQLVVARADNPGEVRTVPTAMVADAVAPAAPVITPGEAQRLEDAIRTTEAGRWYTDLYDRHRDEVGALVRENRHVTLVWHRSGAAELFQWLLRTFTRHDVRLPEAIQGRPVRACLEDIGHALARYGSAGLRADVERLLPVLPDVAGLDDTEILARLRGADPSVLPAPA